MTFITKCLDNVQEEGREVMAYQSQLAQLGWCHQRVSLESSLGPAPLTRVSAPWPLMAPGTRGMTRPISVLCSCQLEDCDGECHPRSLTTHRETERQQSGQSQFNHHFLFQYFHINIFVPMIKITQHKNMLNVDERWDLIIYGKNTFFLPIILVQDCDYYFYQTSAASAWSGWPSEQSLPFPRCWSLLAGLGREHAGAV